jgi:hypothetical protein
MQVPAEFKRFTRCFWQGSDLEAADEKNWIARALNLNTPEQKAVIKRFLDELLNSDADVQELQRVWNSGSPPYGMHDDHVRSFLSLVRDTIE